MFVTVVALFAAVRSIPVSPPGRAARVDVPGALLLGGGLLAMLVVVSQTSVWQHLAIAIPVTAGGAALLAAWAAHERRTPAPLVDIRLLGHRAGIWDYSRVIIRI